MQEPKLSAIGRWQLERYRKGKGVLKAYEKEVMDYLEWEKEQESKNK